MAYSPKFFSRIEWIFSPKLNLINKIEWIPVFSQNLNIIEWDILLRLPPAL